ncbi:tRNA lysidine(34) synthetase TilS [Solirubrum puertoriconensis]|uniref:tRNA(Ile)-lysidine synthase n=1 Tax=Solirubrum puertoriconensis TaxID=1751427 RepID=A0A9X0HP29_SOLP1|nr:tRNA lysidine(34) synthetase TilS [Solirubrum puertoriconensis]KUG09573.1 tRNA(Ile)-lysidine synthetase [Solirubrum puertoriconensis]
MLDRVREFIAENNLFNPETDQLLVAVSGGMDSVVLLDVLHCLGVGVAVAHCHFGLRGEEADADEEFVRKLAKKYDAPYFAEFFDTKGFAAQEGLSTQMAARVLRYQWFEQVRRTQQLGYIATAHHRRDAAETMLLNLTHGTGLRGLHGIPARQGHVVRPLLGIGKEDMFDYVVERRLVWREDSSNESTAYQRNKLRHDVLPTLRELNPNLDETLRHTAERVQGAELLVQHMVEQATQQARRDENEAVYINIGVLQNTPATAVVLQEMLRPFHFSWLVVKDIVASFRATSGRQFESPTHLLVKDRDQLVITPKNLGSFGTYQLQQGQPELVAEGLRLTVTERPAEGYKIPRSREVAAFDADKLKFPLMLRKWREGDWFMPIGLKGKKKLSDFLIDEKVPLNLKPQVPLLVTPDGKVTWVVGMRPDDRFKVTEETQRVLEVRLQRQPTK